MTPREGEVREIEGRILDFIEVEQLSPKGRVGPEDELLTGEVLDSVGVLRLATWLEEEFGIVIDPANFLIENFQSVRVLAGFVLRVRS